MAFDSPFCTRFASPEDAIAAARALVRETQNPFQTTCLRFAASLIDAHCAASSDPYARAVVRYVLSNARKLLDTFRPIWRENPECVAVHRDLAVLLTGTDADYTLSGGA